MILVKTVMKKYLNIGAFVIVFCFILEACKKEATEDVNPIKINTYSLPTEEDVFNTFLHDNDFKTWGSGIFYLSGVGVQDCRNDDKITLNQNGTYIYNNGAISCGSDVQSQSGIWEASFSNSTITFDQGSSYEYTATIASLTETNFVAKGTWSTLSITGTYTAL